MNSTHFTRNWFKTSIICPLVDHAKILGTVDACVNIRLGYDVKIN